MSSRKSRIKSACNQCRFRKMKCDGNHPCQRCSRMGFECAFTRPSLKLRSGRRVELLRQQQLDLAQASPANHVQHEEIIATESSTVEDTAQLTSGDIGESTSPNAMAAARDRVRSNQNQPQVSSPFPSIDMSSTTGTVTVNSTNINSSHWPHQQSLSHHFLTSPGMVQSTSQEKDLSYTYTQNFRGSGDPLSAQYSNQDVGPAEDSSSYNITSATPQASSASSIWPEKFEEGDILQWLDIFFDRLYSTLPIVDRAQLYRDFMHQRHHSDAGFAALILSLCSLSLVQPVFKKERVSMPAREQHAKEMLNSVIKLRTSFDFGERLSLETTATSFFMFAALFGMGLQRAAWLRLREAVECGRLMDLHQPQTYQSLTSSEKSLRLRIFLILSVTERGCALQRNHYISFTGPTLEKMDEVYGQILQNDQQTPEGIVIDDNKNGSAMRGLRRLMKLFDSVDEDVIPCWNKSCSNSYQTCSKLTIYRVQKVYRDINEALLTRKDHECSQVSLTSTGRLSPHDFLHGTKSKLPHDLNELQWADCFVLQQWLLIRLWVSCLTHDLLEEGSELPFMRPSFAIIVADNVIQECRSLGETVLEVHGSGMIERIYDIAMGVVMALQFHLMSVTTSFTQQSHDVLAKYFELLNRLRDGIHPFFFALREAYHSLN